MEQLSLFDADAFKTSKRPGQKTFDQWLSQEPVVYHGSFRSDWTDNPYVHTGTKQQAESRLRTAGKNIGHSDWMAQDYYGGLEHGHDGEYSENATTPKEHIGRLYARRFLDTPHPKNFRDAEANAGEIGARLIEDEGTTIPRSLRDSAGSLAPHDSGTGPDWRESTLKTSEGRISSAMQAAEHLYAGKTIRYENEAESAKDDPKDPNAGYSFISPSHRLQSWEHDVLAEPTATSMARDFASKRIANGDAGLVPFGERGEIRFRT